MNLAPTRTPKYAYGLQKKLWKSRVKIFHLSKSIKTSPQVLDTLETERDISIIGYFLYLIISIDISFRSWNSI